MSAHRTTRRAMLAGAGLSLAATVGAPAAAIHQDRRLASRTFEFSEIRAPFVGMMLPAGLSFPELANEFARLRAHLDAYSRYRSDETWDEQVWQAIREEELSVIDAILSQPPRSLADIACQIEAAAEGSGVTEDEWMRTLIANVRVLSNSPVAAS